MLSLALSAVVFFIAYYFLRRIFDDMELPRGISRTLLTFSLALALACVAAALLDRFLT